MSEPVTQLAPPMTDQRNIVVGKARVIWAKGVGGLPDSWVLPGGGRTTNDDEARRVAIAMHQLMG